MKSFIITKNDAGQRLDKYLTKSFPNLPQSLMYKYIRTKRIKVNSKRAEISTRLMENDVVDLYINDEFLGVRSDKFDFLSAPNSLNIVYEDENILLLNKKVGLLCHPDDKEYVDTLISRVKRYLYEKGSFNPMDSMSFTPALVNRIDRNTCGIVIAAKNAEALRILNEKMKNRELRKFYLCIVHGKLENRSGILEGYLVKDKDKNTVKVFTKKQEGAKYIKTKYEVIAESENFSLIEIELLTGRTHQIRSHFASIGHPLLGDGKYGINKLNRGYKKQWLCSYKLVFDFNTDAGILNYLNQKDFEIDVDWMKDEFTRLSQE